MSGRGGEIMLNIRAIIAMVEREQYDVSGVEYGDKR
jgi:hypothetical protein